MTTITKKQRFARAAAIGAAGFAVASAIILTDGQLRGDWGFLRCATAGAFLAGLIFAGAFGRGGAWGWFYAGAGFGGSTVMGAIFAVLLLPLDGTFSQMGVLRFLGDPLEAGLFGPVYVAMMMGQNPGVAAVWAVALAALHLTAQRLIVAVPSP